jgi:magnesium chelatase subunit I
VAVDGDETPIAWRHRDARYVEKLATPDVTIADMVGDIDPIKAARSGLQLSDELTIHYGLLPRANRGIFAINELPDLAGKIQVGLFNILQEGDVQIKAIPFPLDVSPWFHREPRGLHARGRSHALDRIGPEIRPTTRRRLSRPSPSERSLTDRSLGIETALPYYLREVVTRSIQQERTKSRQASGPQRLRSRLENVVSSAERRASPRESQPQSQTLRPLPDHRKALTE